MRDTEEFRRVLTERREEVEDFIAMLDDFESRNDNFAEFWDRTMPHYPVLYRRAKEIQTRYNMTPDQAAQAVRRWAQAVRTRMQTWLAENPV